MSQYLCPVDPFPQKRVVRNLVELVPGQLRRHEIIDPAFLHDLRQRTGIAEYVRQPQDPAVHAEFLHEKPFAV